jgi:hypothetical protein
MPRLPPVTTATLFSRGCIVTVMCLPRHHGCVGCRSWPLVLVVCRSCGNCHIGASFATRIHHPCPDRK